MITKSIARHISQFAGVREIARYVPRRALLYVPASNQKMLDKVPLMQADSVVLELEDGVALTAKADARQRVSIFYRNRLRSHRISL